jgi:Dolichyl-phosphate-mannose-protein mannosyltransferase
MALFLSAVLCFASGSVLVSLCWSGKGSSGKGSSPADVALRVSLSAGYGLGLFSVVFFVARVFDVTRQFRVDLLVCTLLSAALLARFRKRMAKPTMVMKGNGERRPGRPPRFLAAGFVIAAGAAIYAAIMRTLAYPQGSGWDAFAIWNLHARFLFLGGANWRDGFTPLLPWSHPDYPLLLPAAAAHFWTYLGYDDARVPAAIGFIFTFATAGVLFSALSILRGRVRAMLGTIALLATPAFIEQGTAQYADVPLSFFFLATVALVCLHEDRARSGPTAAHGLLVLAGLGAGFAAWTKNEGLLFLGAIIGASLFHTVLARRQTKPSPRGLGENWFSLAVLAAAIVPGLIIIAYFKHSIAPPGDLFSDPGTTLHKLLTPARYWAVIQWYVKGFFRFGEWLLIPGTLLLLVLYFVTGRDARGTGQAGFRTCALALSLTLAGYFVVYLITPYDIYWHLRFSLTRLFLQVWPSAVFLFFLVVLGAREDLGDEGA